MLYFYQHQIQLYCAVSAEEESGEDSIVTHRKGRFIMAREKADSMKKKAAEEKAAVLA